MPYKSDAQRRFFNANRRRLESEGVDVDEFNAASKGKKLPERKSKRKSRGAFDFMKRPGLDARSSGVKK